MSAAPTDDEMLAGFRKTVSEIESAKNQTPPHGPDTEGEKKHLRSIVDRIVRLEEEKAVLSSDIRDIYVEAKSAGYTKKAVRIIIMEEMEDADARASRETKTEALETEVELMRKALGDYASSPLGNYAVSKH